MLQAIVLYFNQWESMIKAEIQQCVLNNDNESPNLYMHCPFYNGQADKTRNNR